MSFLHNRVALITGASGIGKAIAIGAASARADIASGYQRQSEAGESVVGRLSSFSFKNFR